ncbi:hypothetical protein B0H17DRAFT_1135301 [Mycena rosella]|uniref:BTB domain-containing protein n=1 Tax=Mycena rosella TaxID=1033263 RepID=A0AAD7GI33_MYCRO|nr:hypothetical protein B0H17DRAFT_1135301 [Mycena rosella]
MHSVATPQSMNTASLATVERAESLWFSDGNIIIHAGSMIFRVYRGMLARQSPILEKILDALKLANNEVLDGCPVIHIPFGALETAYFLAAIFDPNSFDSLLGRISFDAIAAVLRLSETYRIPALRRKALILLSSVYPTTLGELGRAGLNPSYCRDQILPVIHLARAHNADWILPLAFYRFCLEMTGPTLRSGVEYGGAQVVLSAADTEACYDANIAMRTENLEQTWARYQARLPDGGCTGGGPCRTSRFRESDTLMQRVIARPLPDLIQRWEPEAGSNLCPACRADMQDWHRKRKQAAWDDLPRLFGLRDWNFLNKLKSQALGDPEDDEDSVTF